jgi:hypothetical protein
MGLKDLVGKRTGRPRGARTSPRVRRDILWAYRHLEDPEAKAPSPGARLWAEHARRQPGRFLACVLRVDTAGAREADDEGDGVGPGREPDGTGGPTGDSLSGTPPHRIRKVFVSAQHFLWRLTGDGAAWVSNLPRDAYVVGCEKDPSRDGIVLTLHSDEFPPVAAGEAIPELTALYAR